MTDSTAGGIFISYRREDASGHAGRLHDHLVGRFGEDRVFIDVESIEAGRDFVEVLEAALSGCRAVIVVIGPRWLSAADGDGRRRLESPDDFVRLEIERALAQRRRVVPVLVQGAAMPGAEELPASIAALSRYQALELSDRHWRADVGTLLGLLDRLSVRAGQEASSLDRTPFPSALITASQAQDAPSGSAPLPFVGRDAEQEVLEGAWRAATNGSRAMVILSGEPGIGKTRLTAETARTAHAQGATVLYGRCDEDLGVPYQPFAEALRYYVDYSPGYELAPRLGEARGELTRLMPELIERVPDLPPPLQADPETERYHLFEAVTQWLAAASKNEPLVLVIDDLHWATKPTLLLFRQLARSALPMRVLVLVTCRSSELGHAPALAELLADLRRVDGVVRVPLTGLDAADVDVLIQAALGPSNDGEREAMARAIQVEAEGHPFFVTEVLSHVVRTRKVEIPDSVREVIGRRVGDLSRDAQRVLRVGSVIGQRFEVDVLEAVIDGGDDADDAVLDALDEATAAQLLTELAGGSYGFSHGLVRAALADELNATRRMRLHRQIGEAIESLRASHLDDYLPALAHHFTRAAPTGVTDRAALYSLLAGRRAADSLAFEEAVDHFEQGLSVVDAAGPVAANDLQECRRDIVFELADLHELRGEYAVAAELYTSLLDGDDGRAARGLAAALRQQGRYPEAMSVVDEAFARATTDDSDAIGMLWLEKGRNLLVTASLIDAIHAFEAGLSVVSKGEPVAGELMLQLARAEASVDRLNSALVHALESRRIFEQHGQRRGLVIVWRILGGIYAGLDRLDDAADALVQGLELAERTGNVEELGGCLINLGVVMQRNGELDEAVECDRRAIAQFERVGHPGRANGYANLAEKLMEKGSYEDALHFCEEAIRLARINNDLLTVADATFTAARVYLRLTRPTEAASDAEAAAELFEQAGAIPFAVEALAVASDAWIQAGETDRAAAANRRAAAM